MSKKPLSKDQRRDYAACKRGIRKCLDGLVRDHLILGEWLAKVKAGELFVEEFESWKEFCDDHLPFGVRRADQLIAAYENHGSSGKPLNERQERELLGLEPAEREAVLAMAAAAAEGEGGPTTAELIRSAAAELEQETKDKKGKEKSQAIARLVNDAEEKGRRQQKPSRIEAIAQVLKKVDGLLAYCAKQHAGLVDVADLADQELGKVRSALYAYESVVKASAEEELRAA